MAGILHSGSEILKIQQALKSIRRGWKLEGQGNEERLPGRGCSRSSRTIGSPQSEKMVAFNGWEPL